jgi:hypothetical protein
MRRAALCHRRRLPDARCGAATGGVALALAGASYWTAASPAGCAAQAGPPPAGESLRLFRASLPLAQASAIVEASLRLRAARVGLGRIVALYDTVCPLYTRFTERLGASMSEPTTRPNPTYDAFGVFGATVRELDRKTLIFSRRVVPKISNAS